MFIKDVFAQGPSLRLPGGANVPNPVYFDKIGGILSGGQGRPGAIAFIFAFAGIGLLLMLILAGFNFLTSAGDPKKLEMGKQRLTYAIVGFLVIFTAYWAVQLAGIIFGIQEIQSTFK
ncbi:hypothetical protein HY032_01935 [Candidatus Gottesmanbacteria bacterium]|nr:hypothetical protein [Candidatus Gottesmanbacteria bacterium]